MGDRNTRQENTLKAHNPFTDFEDNIKKAVEEKLHIDIIHEMEKTNKAADEARKQANKHATRFLPGLEIC